MSTNRVSILLVNPPIYDFSAFDFWLRPLGMLTVAGKIARQAELKIFDFLDRTHKFYNDKPQLKNDKWGRGKFFSVKVAKPKVFEKIPRYFRRFGLPNEIFINFLKENSPCDFAFVQTVLTYWYLGYAEIITAIRKHWRKTKIIIGGPYAMICPEHAKGLGADFVLTENKLDRLWELLGIKADNTAAPCWNVYESLNTAAMKITSGCPFKCTYCTVPIFCNGFSAKPTEQAINELNSLISLGVRNIAFYDDALLYKSDEVLKPFLEYVIANKINVSFHTPNALNARFIDEQTARMMIEAGFKSFYLGFESKTAEFQKQTGAKVSDVEFANAVNVLLKAGAERNSITAYLMLGHPRFEIQEVEESMKFVNSLGIRIMLADYSPIPGTADGKLAEKYVNMDEPLLHNKTAFPIILFGNETVNRIKELCRRLNERIARG